MTNYDELGKELHANNITIKGDDGVVRYSNHVAAEAIGALEAEVVRLREALTEIKSFFNTGMTASIPAKLARKALEPKL